MKKIIAVLVILPVLGITGCNAENRNKVETTTEAVRSDAWEYEYYIEDLDYYFSEYKAAVTKFSEFAALQDWNAAKEEAKSHIEILDNIASIVTPPGLAEYQSDILTAIEYEKEYRRLAVEVFDCYINGYDQSRIDEISLELSELSKQNISIETTIVSAREAAQVYLQK